MEGLFKGDSARGWILTESGRLGGRIDALSFLMYSESNFEYEAFLCGDGIIPSQFHCLM